MTSKVLLSEGRLRSDKGNLSSKVKLKVRELNDLVFLTNEVLKCGRKSDVKKFIH